MIELIIIKYILDSKIYQEFNYVLEEKFSSKDEVGEEISLIFRAIADHYGRHPDTSIETSDRLEQIFHAAYPALPKKKLDLYTPIFDRIRAIEIDPTVVGDYFLKLRNKHDLRRLAEVALQASKGKADEDQVKEIYGRIHNRESSAGRTHNSPLWASTLSYVGTVSGSRDTDSQRFTFRTKTLQKSLGPLRKGDLGVVFARTEVGKSAFTQDCIAHMVPQARTCGVVLANEERGAGYLNRIATSLLGVSRRSEAYREEEAKAHYESVLRAKLIFVHDPDVTYKDFYAFLREVKPDIIFIDQLDKIKGFDNDRYDLELGKIYGWARGIASEFGPVIGISQASESAEGKRWLETTDLANSKTSKPAELDWLLGIGKTHEEALRNIRHFHLIKNKLEGDENTVEEYRHGKFDMLFHPEISRYEDTMKWAKE